MAVLVPCPRISVFLGLPFPHVVGGLILGTLFSSSPSLAPGGHTECVLANPCLPESLQCSGGENLQLGVGECCFSGPEPLESAQYTGERWVYAPA